MEGEQCVTIRSDTVEIVPDILSFGCICQGFVYHLKVSLLNKANRPQKFKVFCSKSDEERNEISVFYESKIIAPGLSLPLTLEMRADLDMSSQFELNVIQSLDKSVVKQNIYALVVPLEVFKHISEMMQLQKRTIYRDGVIPVTTTNEGSSTADSIESFGERDITQGTKKSQLTEALLSPEDIEDLQDMPMSPNLYWDPVEKLLKLDKAHLAKVVVHESWSVEKSIEETNTMWENRYDELENEGQYTIRTLTRLELIQKEGGRRRSMFLPSSVQGGGGSTNHSNSKASVKSASIGGASRNSSRGGERQASIAGMDDYDDFY